MGFEKEANSSSHGLTIPQTSAESNSSSPLLTSFSQLQPLHPLSSQSKTFANVFIAIVGAGVLGLPYTFKRTGWVAGSIMLFTVALLTYHCLMLLVHTRRRLEENLSFPKIKSFGDLGYAVSGPIGRLAVDVMIVLSQAGFCASYLIFISDTMAHVVNHSDLSSTAAANPNPNLLRSVQIQPRTIYMWIMFPIQLGLSSIKTLTHLAPLSIFADVVDIGAMGVVMVEDVSIYLQERPAFAAFTSLSVFFYGVGVSIYAFEGVGVVLPLESESADKDKFGRVLGLSMFLISIMYGLFAVLGYMAFGENTSDIITTNLGTGLLTNVVQIALCINLFFSFPIMMNPVYEVVERRFNEKQFNLWWRWVVVVGVLLVALLVPNFADFLSLVGSSVCCILGLVLPSYFHLKVFKDETGWGWAVVADVLMVVIGIVFAVSGTITSIVEMSTRS